MGESYDEGEKSAKKRKSESLGGLLGSLGQVTQEGKDLLRGKGFRFLIYDYTIVLQKIADLSGETSGHDQEGFLYKSRIIWVRRYHS
jgi:hypothetical protein